MTRLQRKTRVTKEEVIAYREDKKIPSYKRKKNVIPGPGPWTDTAHEFTVKANLRATKSIVAAQGDIYGSYQNDTNWLEKGWYPIVFNITTENLKELITQYGLNQVIAASEHNLSDQLNEEGKPKYGDIIILRIAVDHSLDEDPAKRFISVGGKTNKRSITGFVAMRAGEYKKI